MIYRIQYLFGLFCITLLLSCRHEAHPVNQLTKIEFARSGGWPDPRTAIEIDSSLQCHYYGDRSFSSYYYEGKVSAAFWDTLNRKVDAIDFKTARPDDKQDVADAQYWELIIHYKNNKMRFVRMGLVVTDSLSRLSAWLDNTHKRVELVNVAKSYKFETHFQEPARPDISQIRFPPPIKQQKHRR